MEINVIQCVLSMVFGAMVVIAWNEYNDEKNKAWTIFNFKCGSLYGIKDAVFRVVMENENLKNVVFKDDENYNKIQKYLAEDFKHDFDLVIYGRSSKKEITNDGKTN